MGRPRLSPWIDGSMRPVRVGVYQRWYVETTGQKNYSLWDGRAWLLGADTPAEANDPATYDSMVQSAPWRGRAERAR